ncbi:MAG: cell division protein ZapE [Thiolinea sp.]
MTLLTAYNEKIAAQTIRQDTAQEQAVKLLDSLSAKLEKHPSPLTPVSKKPGGLFGFFKKTFSEPESKRPDAPKGIYLWGGVGRGKTWLMDMFFNAVNIKQKQRYHFHHFMEMLHKAIKQHPDQSDPLAVIAKEFARDIRLLCLDELHLTEVTNARLLLPVLDHLMRNNVVLVTTSNRHPDELYQGNLKKQVFVPYTDFMQQQMTVLHLDSQQDYRTVLAEAAYGDNPQLDTPDETDLDVCFENLSRGEVVRDAVFTINHRPVPVMRASDNIIWLEFAVACEGTRTTSDYIWMTDRYEIVMLSNVHVMTEEDEPAARRFFNMVDELYDRRVRLLFSAETTLDQLYQGRRLTFAFKRTLSRLIAMHTENRLSCG